MKKFNCINVFFLACAIMTALFCFAFLHAIKAETTELEQIKEKQLVTVSGILTNDKIPFIFRHTAMTYDLYLDKFPESCFTLSRVLMSTELEECLENQSVVTLTVASDSIGQDYIAVYGIAINGDTIVSSEKYFEDWESDHSIGIIFCWVLGAISVFWGILALTYREDA